MSVRPEPTHKVFAMIPQCEQHLNKWLSEKIEESLQLEFKSAGALENTPRNKIELSKDVSAFANGIGGLVVYGLSEDRAAHIATAFDPIDRTVVTKEWLEQVITSNIHPKIQGLVIHVIPIES